MCGRRRGGVAGRFLAARVCRGTHDARRPRPIVIEWPRWFDGEATAIAVAVERERPLLAPLFASDHSRIAVRRRIARRYDNGGSAAILFEGVGREGIGHGAAIGELADTAERIAGDAVAETFVFDI